MKTLREEIREATLTKTENIIATFMLDYYEDACFMTSTDVARRLDVSESSVIRFCRTLGYRGYMDFQKNLQSHYQQKVKSISSSITVPAERFAYRAGSKKEVSGNYVDTHFQNTIHNLENAVTQNRMELFEQAADLILNSKKKYIISSRGNTCQGDYFLLYLKHMVDNVSSASHGAINVIDHICDITEDDCVIAYSFPRYSEMDHLAIQMAFDAKANIIVITDKQSALLAQYATILFTASIESNTFFNSSVSAQFITELLCDAISHRIGDPIEERLKKIDKYLSPLGVY